MVEKKPKLTLKQEQVIKNLPKTGYNLAEAMRKSGYSNASALSGHTRMSVLNGTRKVDFFSPEKIKADINYTFKQAKKVKDITNMSRINEHRSKIAGMVVDKSEVDNKNPEKVILVEVNKYQTPSENRIPELIPDDKPASLIENKSNG